MSDFSDFLSREPILLYCRIRVLPGAKKTEIVEQMSDGETWKIRIAAPPEKGKANAELLRFFKKQFGIVAEIVSGETDRTKLIKVISRKN
ncbi:YggU family protein [Candidatus Peregrinibacteria bacterium]|nr:MAG: YggU family protein [Candidatus Peregrinibacteria bacterium]